MDLCHIKNSQLGKEFWRYKGRIVFRGDIVKNEQGNFAVFTEPGASASHLAAAKFMDAISRLPGNSGEDSDAVGAYTQVKLDEVAELLGVPGLVTKTWVSLPRHKWARDGSWKHVEDHNPVVPLELNLYGHPLAGLLWEKYQEKALLSLGFEKVLSWECLYVHRKQQIFLSGYVDDYKMAGKKANIAPMWAALKKAGIDLEDPVPLCNNIYLGCTQHELEQQPSLVAEKRELMTRICDTTATKDRKPASDLKPSLPAGGNLGLKTKKKKKKAKALSLSAGGNPGNPTTENRPNTTSFFSYETFGHVEQTVDRYLELANKTKDSLKPVATPCIDDHMIPAEEFEKRGELSPVAARVVLKAL